MDKRVATEEEVTTTLAQWQIENPTLDSKAKHQEALAEGYKDEVCPKCGAVFLAFHHFVMCDDENCPMKDGNPSLLEQLLGKE